MEFFVGDKSLLLVKRIRRESVQEPGVPWALAVNGAITDEELHALIDSLVPAKEYVESDDNGER